MDSCDGALSPNSSGPVPTASLLSGTAWPLPRLLARMELMGCTVGYEEVTGYPFQEPSAQLIPHKQVQVLGFTCGQQTANR